MRNFGRSYVLKAGQAGQTGFEIDGRHGVVDTPLHISFSVEKSDSSSLNTGKVQLWNLGPKSLGILESKGCFAMLQAGYEDNVALILQGEVTSTTTQQDGSDILTELEVTDGRAAVRDTWVSLSYTGNVNEKTIYDGLAARMGMAVVCSGSCRFVDIPEGFAYAGKAVTCLETMTKNNGKSYSIQNGVLQIFVPGDPVNTMAYLISADTGLISIPKRITITEEGKSTADSAGLAGWEIEYFLNGAIGVGDLIMLQSEYVSGYFRVKKVTIDGDNIEGDWVCTAQVMEVTA